MSVPISRVRRWLTRGEELSPESDLLGGAKSSDDDGGKRGKPRVIDASRVCVLWRGSKDSVLIRSPADLRPGDTIVLPATAEGWNDLGHVPDALPETIDRAETAFEQARDRAVLRLHPALRSRYAASEAVFELFTRICDAEEPLQISDLRRLLGQIARDVEFTNSDVAETCRQLSKPASGIVRESYPDDRGLVLTSRKRTGARGSWYLPPSDEGDDEQSRTLREHPIGLSDHTRHVRDEVLRTIEALALNTMEHAYREAADWHDAGKADERFQAMLRRSDRTDAWLMTGMEGAHLAKSGGVPQTQRQRIQACERAGLPVGFRHEMLSVQIVGQGGLASAADHCFPLILHLIASHHGYARPFAPVVGDDEAPDVNVFGITLTSNQRKACPPHRIDSGIAERFWELTRRYGWWGLAYLEALLRLSDQQASADEDGTPTESSVQLSELAEITA